MTGPVAPKPYTSRGLKRVVNACRYTTSGLDSAFKEEAAFRQELLLVVLAFGLMLGLPVPFLATWPLLASALFVLVVELLNTAVEAVVDLASPDLHPLAKKAKDTGSAAVGVALMLLAIVWLAVLWPIFFS